jgi:ribokinase
MFDVITFGSATRDTFLMLKEGSYLISQGDFLDREGLCFPLGSKIFIKDLQVESGGGGTNTACTFSNQGFKTAYCGKIGDDKRGEAILEDLKKFNVATEFVIKDGSYPTAYSAILSVPHRERTILIYRGNCHFLKKEEIPWEKVKKARWFYLAPLSERSAEIFPDLVDFAKKYKIKLAVNPGNTQLKLDKDTLKSLLKEVAVLILNKEEASLLTGVPPESEEELIKGVAFFTEGIVVITKGREGSLVLEKNCLYRAPSNNVLPLEKTGAGDAFGAGFLSGLLQENSIEYAIQLATANAVSCIQKIGAKNGLLKKGEWGSWPKVKVTKQEINL